MYTENMYTKNRKQPTGLKLSHTYFNFHLEIYPSITELCIKLGNIVPVNWFYQAENKYADENLSNYSVFFFFFFFFFFFNFVLFFLLV